MKNILEKMSPALEHFNGSLLFFFILVSIVILPSPYRLYTAAMVHFSLVSMKSSLDVKMPSKTANHLLHTSGLILFLNQVFTRRELMDIVSGTPEPTPYLKSKSKFLFRVFLRRVHLLLN